MNKLFRIVFYLLYANIMLADSTTGKTFVTLRPPGSQNVALSGLSDLLSNHNKKIFGSHVSIAGFYGNSYNDAQLGQALLAYGKNSFKVKTSDTETGEDGRLYVNNAGSDSVTADSVAITPTQKRFGTQFNFVHALDVLAEGLYVGAHVTVAQVTNNANLKVTNQSAAIQGLTVTDYLNGKLSSSSKQVALKYNIIDNADHTKTGACNAEILVGWNALNNENIQVGAHAVVSVPTDTKSSAIYLFEPRVGNQHWGFGLGTNINANLIKTKNVSCNLFFNGEYRQYFQEVERRTFDTLNRYTLTGIDFTRYVLVTDAPDPDNAGARVGQKLRPAANDLTQDLWLTPGSQFEGTISIGCNVLGASLNAGYNIFFKNAETGFLKNKWINNAIGFTRTTFLITADPDLNGTLNSTADTDQTIDPINAQVLAYNSVLSSSQLTHKLFLAAGYHALELRCPFLINVGVGYEFADQKTTALEGIEAWGKIGISF